MQFTPPRLGPDFPWEDDSTTPSDEFEDTGGEDDSKDADLYKVDEDLRGLVPDYDKQVGTVMEDDSQDSDLYEGDEDLQGLVPLYDKHVGTVNFGSRGITDKRNDFLEGSSGSRFGGQATS